MQFSQQLIRWVHFLMEIVHFTRLNLKKVKKIIIYYDLAYIYCWKMVNFPFKIGRNKPSCDFICQNLAHRNFIIFILKNLIKPTLSNDIIKNGGCPMNFRAISPFSSCFHFPYSVSESVLAPTTRGAIFCRWPHKIVQQSRCQFRSGFQ